MKKRKTTPTTSTSTKSVKKQPEEKTEKPVVEDDEEESGFSNWLKTGQGVEFMKYFVILNSLGVFITMGWPSISKTYEIVKSFFFEEDGY